MDRKVKLQTHEHYMYRSGGFGLQCRACKRGGSYHEDGYRCAECYQYFFIHKECAESPPEINHPFHPQHPLLLVLYTRPVYILCSLCGKEMSSQHYKCSICKFAVDIGCAKEPHPLAIEHPKAHQHPLTLVRTYDEFTCNLCGHTGNKHHYVCQQCNWSFHIECVDLTSEINHPSHPIHPLKFLVDGPPGYAHKECSLCKQAFQRGRLYHCYICKFSLGLECVRSPPPLVLLSPKTHEHKLTLMPRHISFTCNACGMSGDRSPYVCLQCNFVIHRDCIDLPHVISINRHDHRISRTYLLGLGNPERKCKVCHGNIDWSYGAYSCSPCHDYVVHSRCAKRSWDGRELEGEPEEIENIEPFEKIDGINVIKHFSHKEHQLRLNKENIVSEESIVCKACVRPIGSNSFYRCCMQDCDFVLHETCANLPRKKRHVLFVEQLCLLADTKYSLDLFSCYVCREYRSGFRYVVYSSIPVDVQSASISEPFEHESHSHPLYKGVQELSDRNCEACGNPAFMKCINAGCNFALDFKCMFLPRTVKHKYDEHPLFLRYGEKASSGGYWCDICEEETNPKTWFYTCEECGTTLHIRCVLGYFASLMPGNIITHRKSRIGGSQLELKFEVVSNDHSSRPHCCVCQRRCLYSIILKTYDDTDRYICSHRCFLFSKCRRKGSSQSPDFMCFGRFLLKDLIYVTYHLVLSHPISQLVLIRCESLPYN